MHHFILSLRFPRSDRVPVVWRRHGWRQGCAYKHRARSHTNLLIMFLLSSSPGDSESLLRDQQSRLLFVHLYVCWCHENIKHLLLMNRHVTKYYLHPQRLTEKIRAWENLGQSTGLNIRSDCLCVCVFVWGIHVRVIQSFIVPFIYIFFFIKSEGQYK